MPQYVIQRSLSEPGPAATDGPIDAPPGASADRAPATPVDAAELRELGPEVRWVKSYVTERKIYCLYHAPSEDTLRAHARARGFPAEVIERIWAVSSTNCGG
ncbi:MAG TPA: DUF4242 domain-containing protein [Phenylobacterium sp.]